MPLIISSQCRITRPKGLTACPATGCVGSGDDKPSLHQHPRNDILIKTPQIPPNRHHRGLSVQVHWGEWFGFSELRLRSQQLQAEMHFSLSCTCV